MTNFAGVQETALEKRELIDESEWLAQHTKKKPAELVTPKHNAYTSPDYKLLVLCSGKALLYV